MRNIETDTHRNIYGSGIIATASPGVDSENWRYNPEKNNYDFIGKPDEINPEIIPLEQLGNPKVTETKEAALIR
ncbi:MAG: hypothetical protein Q7R82_02240 [Candidatus Daviesbacteria bacterium]|nr:hypothetical protein [Candidatus Daviesbacteria bacterium]